MASFQDYRNLIDASDEVPMIYCEPCSNKGKQIEAEGYCEDCPEYLCGQCYKDHIQYKLFRNHSLKDKNDMPLDGDGRVADVCVSKCKHHRDKTVEYFCVSCDNLCCDVCITINHRGCENVEHIPYIANKLETCGGLKNFSDKLESAWKRLDERHRMILCNSKINDDMLQEAKKELKRQREELNRLFDNIEREIDIKVEQIQKRNKNNLKAASNICGSVRNSLQSIKLDIDTKKKDGQKCEMFIAMQNAKLKLEKLNSDLETMRNESRIQRYKIVSSSQFDDMKKIISSKICEIKTAKLETEINVSTSSDKTISSIWGLTMMHGHYCVIADGDNQSVKVIDTRSKRVTSIYMGREARTITTVNDDLVAVSVSQPDTGSKILLLSVSKSGDLNKHSQIYSKCTCNGLVCANGNLFVAQYCQVQVLNMQGKVLQTISSDSNGKNLFCYAIGIAVSPDNETIYVLDSIKNSVISMTVDGEMKAVHNDPDLANPQGITVDNNGYVYVCSPGTRTVHQLTPNLTKFQILLDEVYGRDIAYSSTTNKLIIGGLETMQIYDMN